VFRNATKMKGYCHSEEEISRTLLDISPLKLVILPLRKNLMLCSKLKIQKVKINLF